MFNNTKKSFVRSLLLCAALLLAGNSNAANTWAQGGHSGGWVNPDEPYHGMFVEVIVDTNSPTGLSIAVAWYAFIDGRQVWVIGFGPVTFDDGEQRADLKAFVYEGNDFPPLYDPSLTEEIEWGDMSIEFDGCDDAVFSWDSTLPGFGSGQMALVRLTTIAESSCNPDLGTGNAGDDDHGNLFATATPFHIANLPVDLDQISGVINSFSDVDVFIFEVFKKSSVRLETQGETDTKGELFLLEGTKETSVATDDNSGDETNFLIEETLDPGIYTIHVRASGLEKGDTGQYLVKIVVTNV